MDYSKVCHQEGEVARKRENEKEGMVRSAAGP